MRPVVRATLAVAAFAALASVFGGPAAALVGPRVHARTLRLAASVPPPGTHPPRAVASQHVETTELSAVCPEGELPDDDHCVRFAAALLGRTRPASAGANATKAADPDGTQGLGVVAAPVGPVRRSTSLEQVPRQDDRPADLDAYAWPLATLSGAPRLGGPGAGTRGRDGEGEGGGGIDLPVVGGEEIKVVKLTDQKGQADLFVREPIDASKAGESWFRVVTHHVVQRAGEEPRDWLVILEPLQRVRDDRAAGTTLTAGDSLGVAAPGALHLEVREVREGLDLASLAGEGLRADDRARRVDPRNVFPLRRTW
jgi:hypothetical protein